MGPDTPHVTGSSYSCILTVEVAERVTAVGGRVSVGVTASTEPLGSLAEEVEEAEASRRRRSHQHRHLVLMGHVYL